MANKLPKKDEITTALEEHQKQVDELIKQKKILEQEEKKLSKQSEEEEFSEANRWEACMNAIDVLNETDMKFYRDAHPKYFRKLQTRSWKKKTNIEYLNTEVKFYPPNTLGENWIKLKTSLARDMFRTMVEGGKISAKNPKTGEWVEHDFPSRVYDKITNTLNNVDNLTYNMLDLTDKLEPNYDPNEVQECPLLHKALFYSITGNVIRYDDEIGGWVGNKEESLFWLEKWVYGTIHADIGNNMASFPVIYGSGKVGRNALFDVILKQCLGKDACFSGTWDIIHGNFDGYKLGKVTMFIDEVPEKGSWDVLKNMTGSTDAFVRQKYGAEFVIDNTVRYAIGTNEDVYPLPVENGPQMMRVSPIKTNRLSTFAENTVKMLDKEKGSGYCRQLLKDSDDTLDVDNMDDFIVGDTLLRNVLQSDWASREACQKLLNYLDSTYSSESGNYSLGPLRGTDWSDIVRDRLPAVQKVVDYVIDQNISTITTMELYEIYKVIQQDRSDAVKKIAGFGQSINELLIQRGYTKHDQAYLANKTRATIYDNSSKDTFSDYSVNIDQYIVEVQMGSNPLGPKQRKLKYNNQTTDLTDNIKDKLDILLNRVNK